jgi:hypothetical protein
VEVSGSAGDSAPAFYDGKVRAIGDCRIWLASEFNVLVLIAISEQGIILDLADEHRWDAEGEDFAGLEGFDKRSSSPGLGFLPVLRFSLGVEEFFCQCREADREGIAHGKRSEWEKIRKGNRTLSLVCVFEEQYNDFDDGNKFES